jgi:hypothetical protein
LHRLPVIPGICVSEDLGSIPLMVIWRNVEIGFCYIPWVTLNFPNDLERWPWETLVHKPLSRGTFVFNTSSVGDMISDGRTDRRIQRGHYAPLNFFGEQKKCERYYAPSPFISALSNGEKP